MAWMIINTSGIDWLQDLGSEYEKESLQNVNSWTAFMKDIQSSHREQQGSIPSRDSICPWRNCG